MGLFSRRQSRKKDTSRVDEQVDQSQEAEQTTQPEQPEASSEPDESKTDRTQGPFDISERTPDQSYVDLGALKIPGIAGMNLHLEIEENSQTVVSVAVEHEDSRVQLQAFAASKSEGLWEGISAQIDDSITEQGGRTDRRDGRFGPELLARVEANGPNGEPGHMIARFVGVDGPRWFLRAVFGGPASINDEASQMLEDFLSNVIVDRGQTPMTPAELLPLRVPEGGQEAATAAESQHDAEANRDNHDPRRGPEITKIG